MSPANETCNLSRVYRAPCPNDDNTDGVECADTKRESVPSTYLDWCYHLSTKWILWCLLDNRSKYDDQKTRDASQVLSRIDSGIEINLLGQNVGHTSSSAALALPIPITLMFYFQDGRATKHICYSTFSKWSAVNALFSELARDGIVVHELWDMNEDMQIGSGDWNARIQPGSAIEAWCFNDKRGYHLGDVDDSSNCESDDETVESDGDGDDTESEYRMSWKGSAKNTRNEHTWWFTRWRQKVEKAIPGRDEVEDERSWFLIVVWCISTIIIITLLVLLNR